MCRIRNDRDRECVSIEREKSVYKERERVCVCVERERERKIERLCVKLNCK